jgi:phosphatidylinositol alpha 1,6-mannosyltransferase
VGDSFTAGTGDDPQHGGWVARTANALTAAGRVGAFRNLAVPGARLAAVLYRQVPLVVDRVEIISAIAGANDLMARRVDPAALLQQVDELLDWALDHADLVLTCTCPNFLVGRSAHLPRLAARIHTINEYVEQRRTSAAGRLIVVDAHTVLAEPALWATDGIHANPNGHALLADTAIPLLNQATLPLR